MKIPSKKLGNNTIPVLGLGTWRLMGSECINSIRKAIGLGYTHLDTAEIYGNEKEIGEAIQNFDRKKLFVTSKVWTNHFKYKETIKTCRKTLKDLGTDYMDLYLVHWPDGNAEFTETLKAMQELKKEGKIKSIGVSNFNIKQLEKAMDTGVNIVNNQIELYPKLYKQELLEFCKENNITVTAYCPVARGKVFEMDTIKNLSEKYNKTPAQISLRWLIQKGAIVIPKSSSPKHQKENIEIFDWSLNEKDERKIDNLGNDLRLVML